ncbi:MAG: hypothetical protein Q4G62_12065 [Pseudomonadota bacterium]|nr:hypothetical protein [Pseudomonadota bacterium]
MGKGSGEVRQDPATQADLDRYTEAEQQLAQMQAPAPRQRNNPQVRLNPSR